MNAQAVQHLHDYLGLVQLHRGERITTYDGVATAYDGFAQIWDQHIAVGAMARCNQLLAHHITPGVVVLDAGAGTGERTQAILGFGQPQTVVALDASAGMLRVASSKNSDPRVQFLRGDVRHVPFADNTFDVVVCTWVIEILDDPWAAVQEFVRVIKPDGIVIYAFCSLPEGPIGTVLQHVIARVGAGSGSLSHLLSEAERPFHQCEQSSLVQFAGGLTTVATVAKCCPIIAPFLP